MNARSLVLALSCALACDSTSTPAAPTKADAKADAKVDAKAEPPPETQVDSKVEPKVEPEPEVEPEPIAHSPEPKVPVGPPVLTADLEPPESSRILALARDKGLGKPAIAAKPATSASVETKGTAHHEDLDADGHPDLRIAYSTKDEAKPKLQESRWRWVAADDTWAPLTTGAKLPPYDRSGCDW